MAAAIVGDGAGEGESDEIGVVEGVGGEGVVLEIGEG